MKQISLLDCTLRDGGFINDWDFGLSSIRDIIFRLEKSNIEFVEIGFIDDRRIEDINRTIFPNTVHVKHFLEDLKIEKSKVIGMIDYGTCSINNIDKCEDSLLDGIRVIFKKAKSKDAIDFCSKLIDKGYDVFIQPVSITSYSDKELLDLISEVNSINPYAVSIVDTYGLVLKNDLIHYFNLMERNLDKKIALGYHSHNNFQLAYSNAIELISMQTNRHLVIDASLYGMGKGAGNANTELIAMFLNNNYHKNYIIDHLLEAIEVNILNLKEKYNWGYSFDYYLSASNDCHPNYVKFLLNKKSLSIKDINKILNQIDIENKLLYNESLIEELYNQFHKYDIDDYNDFNSLLKVLENKKILIIAPGNSINDKQSNVLDYISENNPIIFSVNFIPKEYKINYIFVSNSKRYNQLLANHRDLDNDISIIATSNITESSLKINHVLNYNRLKSSIDNSTLFLLNLLLQINVSSITIAGFDGFGKSSKEYSESFLDFHLDSRSLAKKNKDIKNELRKIIQYNKINFLTESSYL